MEGKHLASAHHSSQITSAWMVAGLEQSRYRHSEGERPSQRMNVWCLPATRPGSGNAAAAFPGTTYCSWAVVAFQLGRLCIRDSKTHLHEKLKEGCFLPRLGGGSPGGKEVSLEAVVGVCKRAKRREVEMMRLQSLKFSV